MGRAAAAADAGTPPKLKLAPCVGGGGGGDRKLKLGADGDRMPTPRGDCKLKLGDCSDPAPSAGLPGSAVLQHKKFQRIRVNISKYN